MAKMVLMPQMGVSEESALLAEWLVKEGDVVKSGQALFSLETGKSSFECLAECDGTLLKIFVEAGEEVKVGSPVGVVGNPGESFETPVSSENVAPAPAKEDASIKTVAAPAVSEVAVPVVEATGHINASPRAKNLAQSLGLDISQAGATGPNGRVIERDVKALADNGPVASTDTVATTLSAPAAAENTVKAAYEDQPISRIRKVIAENMHSSLAEMAQLTLSRTFDASGILAMRKRMKASEGFGLEKVTINDFILFAVARTLPEFPDINANFIGDKMRRFTHAQLGVAVDTPKGLLVPVIKDADLLSLRQISEQVRSKAKLCRDGGISGSELFGGSFTVTSLGSLGIESFTPIINPPQTAILGVCGVTQRARETGDGEMDFYPAMGLSLTFDHRVVDGAPAAKFLKALAERLEKFDFLLAM